MNIWELNYSLLCKWSNIIINHRILSFFQMISQFLSKHILLQILLFKKHLNSVTWKCIICTFVLHTYVDILIVNCLSIICIGLPCQLRHIIGINFCIGVNFCIPSFAACIWCIRIIISRSIEILIFYDTHLYCFIWQVGLQLNTYLPLVKIIIPYHLFISEPSWFSRFWLSWHPFHIKSPSSAFYILIPI